jgi:amino acid transporter
MPNEPEPKDGTADHEPPGQNAAASQPPPADEPDSTEGGLADEVKPEGTVLPSPTEPGVEPQAARLDGPTDIPDKLKEILIGKPRDLADRSLFHAVSLAAFLAWVGLGADGLSSSAYGPAEAFENLDGHEYLAVFLAIATVATVVVISACYSLLIEDFPSGGGGYLVAAKQLGSYTGAVSGCALLVDYVLTVTVSIAAAGDALFGLIDPSALPLWTAQQWKVGAEFVVMVVLIILNLRGIRESVMIMMPVFLLFLLTHAIVIFGVLVWNVTGLPAVAEEVSNGLRADVNNPTVGLLGVVVALLYAYSLGAGTYTGIEAVSNSMGVMREPKVATAQRTMRYMAISLSVTAAGLIVGYLLLKVRPDEVKTMNLILTERFMDELGLHDSFLGTAFVFATLLSEGALLVIAAQAGFIGGPRLLSNMALDSWVPHWFGSLSERLASHNGILVMGISAIVLLVATMGDVSTLLIMYSINVFLTFSLSMLGMCRQWWSRRGKDRRWKQRVALFVVGAVMCVSILTVTVVLKFTEGGWITLVVTGICVAACIWIRRHYTRVMARLKRLDQTLEQIPTPSGEPERAAPDPDAPTAAILVGGYTGLGVHTFLNVTRFAPGYFKNAVFLSVGVVDSGTFKGASAVEDLKGYTERSLERYVDLARRLRFPSTSFLAIGTDAVDELEDLCRQIARQYPKVVFFAGQLMFRRDAWHQRLLHNQTAYSLQRRLQWDGLPMVILPTRVK